MAPREKIEEYGKRGDDLEVKTPFGWSVRAGGRQVQIIIVILLVGGFLAYQQWQHEQNGAKRAEDLVRQMLALQQTLQETTYVLTLSEEERRELKLAMPETLKWRVYSPQPEPRRAR